MCASPKPTTPQLETDNEERLQQAQNHHTWLHHFCDNKKP